MTPSSNAGDELDELEIEFLHGVPVKLPPEAIAAIRAWSAQQVREARIDELHELELSYKNGAYYSVANDWWTSLEGYVEERLSALQAIANQGVLPTSNETELEPAAQEGRDEQL
jgi:hypothetical protein